MTQKQHTKLAKFRQFCRSYRSSIPSTTARDHRNGISRWERQQADPAPTPVELPRRSHGAVDGVHVHQQTIGTAIVGSVAESHRVMDLATVADASGLVCGDYATDSARQLNNPTAKDCQMFFRRRFATLQMRDRTGLITPTEN